MPASSSIFQIRRGRLVSDAAVPEPVQHDVIFVRPAARTASRRRFGKSLVDRYCLIEEGAAAAARRHLV
jgi:hypothetical protein